MTAVVLLLALASPARAEDVASSPPVMPGTAASVTVRTDVVTEVRDDFKRESDSALRSTWSWAAVAVASGVYAGVVLAGGGGNEPALKYLSFVGVLAGVTGAVRGGMRAHRAGALRAGLDEGLNVSAGQPGTRLSRETADATGQDLHRRLISLRSASRGALRSGCVLPVLLGGIGFYGLTTGGAGGDELAGVGLGGALVIGAPAMLSYFGLQGRLRRMEGIVTRWDDAVPAQEMSK